MSFSWWRKVREAMGTRTARRSGSRVRLEVLEDRVVPAGQLDSSVADLLERVTRGSAESKAIGKQALYAQIDLDQPKAYAYAIEVMAATSQLPDAREGMRAFLDKRKPRWRRGRQ